MLYTNQARENGVKINDVIIKYNEPSRFDMNFVEEGTSILLPMNKLTPYISMRYSTYDKLNERRHVELASYNEWNTYNDEINICIFIDTFS